MCYGLWCLFCFVSFFLFAVCIFIYFLLFTFFFFFYFCFFFFFFFFQAEDGIRDRDVTGVQTCALPICFFFSGVALALGVAEEAVIPGELHVMPGELILVAAGLLQADEVRSEERRVGKECRCRWATEQ